MVVKIRSRNRKFVVVQKYHKDFDGLRSNDKSFITEL